MTWVELSSEKGAVKLGRFQMTARVPSVQLDNGSQEDIRVARKASNCWWVNPQKFIHRADLSHHMTISKF